MSTAGRRGAPAPAGVRPSRHLARQVPLLLVLLLVGSRAVRAQEAIQGTRAGEGSGEGLTIANADGSLELQIGGTIQADGRFVLAGGVPPTDLFTMRKARPAFAIRIDKVFTARLVPDFANGATLISAYLETHFSTRLRVRMGLDKTPVGYEYLQGDASVLLPERTLVSDLVPQRDIGVQALGDLAGGRVSYAAGLFNGVPDGTGTSNTDENAAKDVVGRLVLRPFERTNSTNPLAGLGVHVGASTGVAQGTLTSFHTSVGRTFFSYAGAVADGRRTRVSPAVFYYHDAIGAFGEYVMSSGRVTHDGVHRTITNHAWETTGSLVLTGEAASEHGVIPRHPFDPAAGTWGAVQLAVRFAVLTVDPAVFDDSLAAPEASQRARQASVDLTWYPNRVVRYYATYERTSFATPLGPAPATEHTVIIRAQLAF